MITPHPTSKIDPVVARGVLGRLMPASAGRPELVVFTVPNTSYELHLIPTAPVTAQAGKRILGVIRVLARRIDLVTTGGQFLEPVYGPPQRVQGTVIAIVDNALVVQAGVPVHVTPTDARQTVGQFQVGQLVSFDAQEGATFTPAG